MSKMKVALCVVFSLCCFAVVVFGSTESDESKTTTERPLENLEGLFSYFKTLENRIRELEKSQEECKSLKISYEKSGEEMKEQIKSLNKKVDEMNNKTRRDDGVWLLTPRLTGPPGKQGEAGQKGEAGQVGSEGARGKDGKSGEAGVKGEKGDLGITGPQGETGVTGQQGAKGDRGISALESITSCSIAMEILPSSRSTKQWIYPHGNANSKIAEVLCDFESDGGGWTVIQKRASGPLDEFNKTWNEYAREFGSLDGNFWLGLENIRALTKNGDQELRIELEDFEGNKRWAKYSNFSISDASDFYRLSIGGFSGNSTAGDSMTNSHSGYSWSVLNGMRFSTWDKDNDLWDGDCVDRWGGGGWWFNVCSYSHLNGRYLQKGASGTGIYWYLSNSGAPLAKSEMKIRTRK